MSATLADLTRQLQSERDPTTRDVIVAEMGDLFEHALFDRITIDKAPFRLAVDSLIVATLSEDNVVVRESMLYALTNASSLSLWQKAKINFDSLVSDLEVFSESELDYVLCILGFTHNRKYVPVIQRYLVHSNLEIQEYAKEALVELGFLKLEPDS